MSREQIKQTIDEFLSLVEKGCGSAEENGAKLELLLDKLALAQHFVTYEFDEKEHSDAPQMKCEDLRKLVISRFSNLGSYDVIEDVTQNTGEGKVNVGDAIDDITDIAKDLFKAQWFWENVSPDRGLWYFEFSFVSHWSWHLRGLQAYLLNVTWGN